MSENIDQCNICKTEYTSIHVEAAPGITIFVCSTCLEKAKDNFIWLCVNCGKAYLRPKELVINRVKDYELKRAYLLYRDSQLIQGIDMCISCNPEKILDYVEEQEFAMEC